MRDVRRQQFAAQCAHREQARQLDILGPKIYPPVRRTLDRRCVSVVVAAMLCKMAFEFGERLRALSGATGRENDRQGGPGRVSRTGTGSGTRRGGCTGAREVLVNQAAANT